MANQFKILLDNPNKTFTSDDEITGKVILSSLSRYDAKGIRIRLKGEESIVLDCGSSKLYANLTLIDEEIYLVGDGQSKLKIAAGHYEYTFRFVLRKGLPESTLLKPTRVYSGFACIYGGVFYEIEATVIMPWYERNLESNVDIEVDATVELNNFPDAKMQAEISKTNKTLFCFCFPRGSVVGRIRTSRKGYIPGENIQFDAKVQNDSFRNVTKLKVALAIEISYTVHKGGRPVQVKYDLVAVEREGVSAGNSDEWMGLISVPQISPSSVGKHILDLQYFLRLEVCLAGTPWNLKMKLPLIIGTDSKSTTPATPKNCI